MVTSHPFSLISVANGSFLCAPCGETIYDLRHCCEEQREDMAKQAAKLISNEDN
jgi:hypothetical protein